jgi:hypothetical protein
MVHASNPRYVGNVNRWNMVQTGPGIKTISYLKIKVKRSGGMA